VVRRASPTNPQEHRTCEHEQRSHYAERLGVQPAISHKPTLCRPTHFVYCTHEESDKPTSDESSHTVTASLMRSCCGDRSAGAAIGWVVSTNRRDGDAVSQTELRTRDGQATTVSDDAITALAEVLRGRLLQPSDADYDDARAVWNGMVDRHPALIVQCAGVADVVTSVNFAKEHDLRCRPRRGPQCRWKCGVRRRARD
jgi:hypothetical protein